MTSQFTATHRLSEHEVKRSGWRTAVSAYSMVEKRHWLGRHVRLVTEPWGSRRLGPGLYHVRVPLRELPGGQVLER